MHVLVTEEVFGDGDAAVTQLRALGHQVSTCHGDGGLCRAVTPGSSCPLDGPLAVDLVIDVRGCEPELTAREFGAVCAVRASVPVALVSTFAHQLPEAPPGLARHVHTYTADQLTKACDDVQRGSR